jgi:hypothetical protein
MGSKHFFDEQKLVDDPVLDLRAVGRDVLNRSVLTHCRDARCPSFVEALPTKGLSSHRLLKLNFHFLKIIENEFIPLISDIDVKLYP